MARLMTALSVDVVSFMKTSSRLLFVFRVAPGEDHDPSDWVAVTHARVVDGKNHEVTDQRIMASICAEQPFICMIS